MSRSSERLKSLAGTRVAVTGGTGFIGRRVVAELVSHGAAVTSVTRSGRRSDRLAAAGARAVVADLARADSLRQALDGCAALLHFAYDVRADAASNLAAFDGVLAAAKSAGVPRIVHASSIVVYDAWPHGPVSEDAPWGAAGGGAYRQAKIAMEKRLLDSQFQAAILQPTLVYGPGSLIWTENPLRALRSGGLVLPDPAGLAALVHADDVALAAALATACPDLGRERFIVTAPPVPWEDYLTGLARAAGVPPPVRRPLQPILDSLGPEPPPNDSAGPPLTVRVSAALRGIVGHERFEAATAALTRLRRPKGPAWPDRFLLRLYAARPDISAARAKARLGFSPRVSLEQGLDGIARQFR
ncbi:MAG: NAD-dependent epimerase/dehydratase family protein [Paracoccaceae bacterium]